MTDLHCNTAAYTGLLTFLSSEMERFVFLHLSSREGHDDTWDIAQIQALDADTDYETQSELHLVVSDAARRNAIRIAHQNNYALAEAHFHGGSWPARFSQTDMNSLSEAVPQLLWRLPGRPYIALVLTDSNFDALVFSAGGIDTLGAWVIDGQAIAPTGLSQPADPAVIR